MNHRLYFITHPDVIIDPKTPVPQWGLSDKGKKQMQDLIQNKPWVNNIDVIYSSIERKAIEAAKTLANYLELDVNQEETLGEIDRSATGFIGDGFEAVVDQFFARPHQSIRGWERAKDAQDRIVSSMIRIIEQHPNQTIAIISHGAVGALYLAHVLGKDISRKFDQPSQGHYMTIDTKNMKALHQWKSINQEIT